MDVIKWKLSIIISFYSLSYMLTNFIFFAHPSIFSSEPAPLLPWQQPSQQPAINLKQKERIRKTEVGWIYKTRLHKGISFCYLIILIKNKVTQFSPFLLLFLNTHPYINGWDKWHVAYKHIWDGWNACEFLLFI